MPSISDRITRAWNAFLRPSTRFVPSIGSSYGSSPIAPKLMSVRRGDFIAALYNRIAMDVSSVEIRHVKIDMKSKQYKSDVDSPLNDCLTLSANMDQTGRSFIQDVVLTMFDNGTVAIVPIDTDVDPLTNDSFKIYSLRSGIVTEWFPDSVRVEVYNDRTGNREELIYPKNKVAIVQNPLYSVMNEPNSMLQRLLQKLRLLDVIDEQSSSGKLDLIIQLPYTIKSEARRKQAEERRKDLENQLANSKYGVGYIDATDRITQLNRPVENNLLSQIQYLTPMVYGQLGISEAIMNGTANEQEMLNYYTRTLDPILTSICDALSRIFLTKTARSQGQSIKFFRDPFRLVQVNDLAEIAQKLISSQVATSNEIRSAMFWPQANDPSANQLMNPNVNTLADAQSSKTEEPTNESQSEGDVNEEV